MAILTKSKLTYGSVNDTNKYKNHLKVNTGLLHPEKSTIFKKDLTKSPEYINPNYEMPKFESFEEFKKFDKPYFQQKLTYTDDGRLMDENGQPVMMEWEDEIMKRQAATICQNGGDIINVGFGMGIIDNYIEEHRPRTHWIIEAHPDVQKKIIKDGWLKKPHVKVIFGRWQDVYKDLPKFDGVYIDTRNEPLRDFMSEAHNLVKPDGIFSYFNNQRDDEHGLHTPVDYYEILFKHFNIEYEEFDLDWISDINTQTSWGGYYWNPEWNKYYNPVFTLRQEYR